MQYCGMNSWVYHCTVPSHWFSSIYICFSKFILHSEAQRLPCFSLTKTFCTSLPSLTEPVLFCEAWLRKSLMVMRHIAMKVRLRVRNISEARGLESFLPKWCLSLTHFETTCLQSIKLYNACKYFFPAKWNIFFKNWVYLQVLPSLVHYWKSPIIIFYLHFYSNTHSSTLTYGSAWLFYQFNYFLNYKIINTHVVLLYYIH